MEQSSEERKYSLSLADFDAQAQQLAHKTAGNVGTPEGPDSHVRRSEGATGPHPAAIRFTATLAGANTAARWLSVGHDGDSKVTFEVAATELAAVLKLSLLSNQAFNVTIQPMTRAHKHPTPLAYE